MFDFKYWFSSIVGTCELIASEDAFRRVWITGEVSITSIHYYLELFEQLMGDLRLGEYREMFPHELRTAGAFDTPGELEEALLRLDGAIEARGVADDPAAVLALPEWAGLQAAARRVIELPAAMASRTGRTDIKL